MDKNRDRLTYRQIVPPTAVAGALAYILISYANSVVEVSDMNAEWGLEQYAAATSAVSGLIFGYVASVGSGVIAGKLGFDVPWFAGHAFMGLFSKRKK